MSLHLIPSTAPAPAPSETAAAVHSIEQLLDAPRALRLLVDEVQALRKEVAALKCLLPPTLVTIAEAAERLSISSKTVRKLIATRRLRAIHLGTALRVDLGQISAEIRPNEE